MDYAFLRSKGHVVSEGDPGWDDEKALKLLIVKDSTSRAVFAHAIKCLPDQAKWNAESIEAVCVCVCVYHHLTYTKWLMLELRCMNALPKRVTMISQGRNPLAGKSKSRARS